MWSDHAGRTEWLDAIDVDLSNSINGEWFIRPSGTFSVERRAQKAIDNLREDLREAKRKIRLVRSQRDDLVGERAYFDRTAQRQSGRLTRIRASVDDVAERLERCDCSTNDEADGLDVLARCLRDALTRDEGDRDA